MDEHHGIEDLVEESLKRETEVLAEDLVGAPRWQRAAATVVNARWFMNLVISVIVANAVIIGVETYDTAGEYDTLFNAIDRALLTFFTIELFVRCAAYRFRLHHFWRSGWNVFDTIVVAASYMPGIGQQATALRLVRLLRVARLLSFISDMHVLFDGLRRAARPAFGLLVLTILLVYMYAVVGWTLFHDDLPERWGTLGEAMYTLFTLLTLEGWNEIGAELRDVQPVTGLLFVMSFILVGTFVVLNMVIGIVITSLDEAYAIRRKAAEGPQLAGAIEAVRNALEDLEREAERVGYASTSTDGSSPRSAASLAAIDDA